LNFFLDTNICIYFLKGISTNINFKLKQTNPNNIKIPSVVKAELLFGAAKSNREKQNTELINKFLLPLEIIPFDSSAAGIYAIVRSSLEKKGKVIGPNDLMIASIVMANNGTLVTNNLKEFKRIGKLKVVNWT